MNIHQLIEARGCGPRVFHRAIGDIPGCKPAPHDETLCESMGIPEDEPLDAISNRYCEAIRLFVSGENPDEKDMMRVTWSIAALGNTPRRRSKAVKSKPGPGHALWLQAEHEAAVLRVSRLLEQKRLALLVEDEPEDEP